MPFTLLSPVVAPNIIDSAEIAPNSQCENLSQFTLGSESQTCVADYESQIASNTPIFVNELSLLEGFQTLNPRIISEDQSKLLQVGDTVVQIVYHFSSMDSGSNYLQSDAGKGTFSLCLAKIASN